MVAHVYPSDEPMLAGMCAHLSVFMNSNFRNGIRVYREIPCQTQVGRLLTKCARAGGRRDPVVGVVVFELRAEANRHRDATRRACWSRGACRGLLCDWLARDGRTDGL